MTKPSYEELEKCPNCGKPKDAPDPFGCEAVFHWTDEQLAKSQSRVTKPTYSEVVKDRDEYALGCGKLQSELARVRGLLQRLRDALPKFGAWHRIDCAFLDRQAQSCDCGYLALLVESATFPQGAESADIGKLDSADEKVGAFCAKCGHEPHGAYCCRSYSCYCDAVPRPDYRTCGKCKTSWSPAEVKQCPTCAQSIDEQFKGMATDEKYQTVTKELLGSAETGGEKAAGDSIELAKKICWEIYGDESLSAITIIADTIDYIERRPTFPRSSHNQTVSSGVE